MTCSVFGRRHGVGSTIKAEEEAVTMQVGLDSALTPGDFKVQLYHSPNTRSSLREEWPRGCSKHNNVRPRCRREEDLPDATNLPESSES